MGRFSKNKQKVVKKKLLKQKKCKKKRKRYEKRRKIISKSLKIFCINAAGINSKLMSFNEILNNISPQMWMLQETKLKPNEQIKCEAAKAFQIFYLSRQKSQGGGLALGVLKELLQHSLERVTMKLKLFQYK